MMNAVVDFTGQKVGVIKTVEEASAVVERMNRELGFIAQVNLHEGLQSLLDE